MFLPLQQVARASVPLYDSTVGPSPARCQPARCDISGGWGLTQYRNHRSYDLMNYDKHKSKDDHDVENAKWMEAFFHEPTLTPRKK